MFELVIRLPSSPDIDEQLGVLTRMASLMGGEVHTRALQLPHPPTAASPVPAPRSTGEQPVIDDDPFGGEVLEPAGTGNGKGGRTRGR